MFPSSFIFCICTRSRLWPVWVMRRVSNVWSLVCPALQIIHIKVESHKNPVYNLDHWNILLTSGERAESWADIDTGRPGYYHHQCQVSGNFNFLQMGRWAGGIIMPKCASQIWLLWRQERRERRERRFQQLPTNIQTVSGFWSAVLGSLA